MSAAVVIWHRQEDLFKRFRDAGATTPTAAKALNEIDVRPDWHFRHLARAGVFLNADGSEGDRWHVDLPAWHAYRERQWRRFIRFVLITAIVGALLIFLISIR